MVEIVLAEDHEVVRSGLRLLLESEAELEVVAEAGNLEETGREVEAHHPHVLVLDLNMPEGPSLPLIAALKASSPGTAVVVLTMQNDPAFARAALDAGALAYVLKQARCGASRVPRRGRSSRRRATSRRPSRHR